jgi:hypothetical protein
VKVLAVDSMLQIAIPVLIWETLRVEMFACSHTKIIVHAATRQGWATVGQG